TAPVERAPEWRAYLEQKRALSVDDPLWETLLAFGPLLGVKHVLFERVRAAQALDALPEWLARDWEADYFKNAARNAAALLDLKELLAAFEREKIPVIPFKGSALLLSGVYTSPAQRILSDLDVMVHEQDLDRAHAAAVRLGYTEETAQTALTTDEYRLRKN